jgi:hypothetical protein
MKRTIFLAIPLLGYASSFVGCERELQPAPIVDIPSGRPDVRSITGA